MYSLLRVSLYISVGNLKIFQFVGGIRSKLFFFLYYIVELIVFLNLLNFTALDIKSTFAQGYHAFAMLNIFNVIS